MSSRSPAAILFDVSGNLAVIQSGFPATGTVTGSAPGVMMAGSDGQFARLLKTATDGTLQVTGSLAVTGSVGITNQVTVTTTGTLPVAVQGQVGVNNFPAVQNVSGTVNVGNWPPVVAVTGSQPTGSTHQGSPVVVGGVFTSGSYIKSLYVDVSGALYVTTSGSLPVTGGIQVLNQVAVSGAIHVTNQVINVTGSVAVTGSLAVDNVVRVTATGSLPVHVDSQVGINNFPETQRVSGSVATYTQGPQLVSGTVYVTGSVAVYTHGAQNVTGSVNVYTDGPQRVTGSVAIYTQGPQNVTGSVNAYTHGPQAVSGSLLTGSTFHGYPVVIGGVSGSTVQVPAVVDKEPAEALFAMLTRALEVTRPTFHAVFDRISPAANKYMATLWNGASGRKVVVQRIWRFNWQVSTVTGVNLDQELRRITARTAGTTVTPVQLDTADVLTSGIVADHNSSAVTDSSLLQRIAATSEERDVLDTRLVDWLSLTPWGLIYDRKPGTRGIVLRQNEGITVKNITTSTVGTVSYVIEFTDEVA